MGSLLTPRWDHASRLRVDVTPESGEIFSVNDSIHPQRRVLVETFIVVCSYPLRSYLESAYLLQ